MTTNSPLAKNLFWRNGSTGRAALATRVEHSQDKAMEVSGLAGRIGEVEAEV
jgi:hypothetical protein